MASDCSEHVPPLARASRAYDGLLSPSSSPPPAADDGLGRPSYTGSYVRQNVETLGKPFEHFPVLANVATLVLIMTDRITSVHNPRIRRAVRLRTREARESEQLCVIDGAREIGRALDAGLELTELFVCEASLRPAAKMLVSRAAEQGVRPCYVPPPVQARLAFGDRDEGIVAIARPPRRTLADLHLAEAAVVAVLAGLEKPGNVGAVVRSADAAGISALIVADGGTDLFNPNAVRASIGTIFAFPIIAAAGAATIAWLRAERFRIYATRVDSTSAYTDASFTGRAAIVLGSEATGLGALWSGPDVTPISLPMLGVADSLNVSVTAAVLFYEALRQRSL